jgi:hypothetical protein
MKENCPIGPQVGVRTCSKEDREEVCKYLEDYYRYARLDSLDSSTRIGWDYVGIDDGDMIRATDNEDWFKVNILTMDEFRARTGSEQILNTYELW